MNSRNTIQRALVLDMVNRLDDHPGAGEIYNGIHQEHPNVSRGTVYRNLNRLAESGEVLKIEIPNGEDRFDHRRDKHYHMECVRCGGVFDINTVRIDAIKDLVRDTRGFQINSCEILFKGVCPDCMKAETDGDGNLLRQSPETQRSQE